MTSNENFADRRRAPRIPVKMRAHLRIHVPEFPDKIMRFGVETCDISQFGMRVAALNVPHDYYRLIMPALREALIKINLPGSPEAVRLRGRVVWTHFDERQQPTICQFGLCFENQSPEEAEALARAIGLLQETITG